MLEIFSQYHQCFVKSLTQKMLPWKDGLCIYTYVRNNFNVFKFPTDFEHPGIYLGHEMQLVRSTFAESQISITLFKNSWRSVNTIPRHRLSVSALLSDGRASWDGTIYVVLLQAAAVSSGIGSSSPFLCLLEERNSKGGYVFLWEKGGWSNRSSYLGLWFMLWAFGNIAKRWFCRVRLYIMCVAFWGASQPDVYTALWITEEERRV